VLIPDIDLYRNPEEIPWGDAGADYVVESTGVFTTIDKVLRLGCSEIRSLSSLFNIAASLLVCAPLVTDWQLVKIATACCAGKLTHQGWCQEGRRCTFSHIPSLFIQALQQKAPVVEANFS
jgi:hypothetical protein